MIKTKLILVDGIPGSGKSTTAHFIYRQIEKNGIKVKWVYEEENKHPLLLADKKFEKGKDEPENDYSKRIMKAYYAMWKKFIKIVEKEDSIYIIESFLFQDILYFPHFANDLDKKDIKKYSHKILNAARHLDPVIVHLYQKDAKSSMRRNWQRRGDEWKVGIVKSDVESLYCKNRNLLGDEGSLQIWQDFTDFTVELFKEYKFNKIQIENLKQDWTIYRKRLLEFFGLKEVSEKLYEPSYSRFFGEYLGPGYIFKVHELEGRLCMDSFWPNLKLLPVSKNEFEMEGFPISVKFYKYGGKKRFKFSKALCYFTEGNTGIEHSRYIMDGKNIEKFCGIYWCEKDKLERKLYLKDDTFYYWREEGNQSKLIQISDTGFMMEIMDDNRIKFKKVKGKWQFTFDIKGEKPVHSLFMPKVTYTSTRIVKDEYTDKEWQEYFGYRTKCAELKKIGLHFKTWEELKDTTIKYLDKGSGIYMVRKDGNNAGVFFLDKAYTDKPDYKHIYFSHYLIDDPINHHLLKLVLKEYLAIDPDHGFLAISSKNGEYDYLGEKLNGEIGTNQVHYELLKENIKKEVVEDWVKTYPAKFPDYTLKFYEDIPDELLDEYCEVFTELLLEMPANSMLNEPRVYPEKIKENQERNKTTNHTSYRYLIFDEKNRLIAKTNVAIDKNKPQAMHQYMTGTKKEYRCSGLGKWMKGAMILKLVADFPEFEKITTETHIENHGSKSISEQMGYKQIALFKEYKVTREKAEAFIKG